MVEVEHSMEEGVVEEYLKSVEWRVKGWMVEEVTHPVEEVIPLL